MKKTAVLDIECYVNNTRVGVQSVAPTLTEVTPSFLCLGETSQPKLRIDEMLVARWVRG